MLGLGTHFIFHFALFYLSIAVFCMKEKSDSVDFPRMVHCMKTGHGLRHFGMLRCNVSVLQTVRYVCLCVTDIHDDILMTVPSHLILS